MATRKGFDRDAFNKQTQSYRDTVKNAKTGKSKSNSQNTELEKAKRIASEQSQQARERKRSESVARKTNSYDEDMKVLNAARQNSQRYSDLKDEGRRHYDGARKSQSRIDTIRQNARAKAGGYENAARRENYERESYASRYASSGLAGENRRKLEQAFKEEKNGGKKVQLRNANLMKKYGR